LLKAQELLAMTLITMHNVAFMNRLLKAIRTAIAQGCLDEERKEWVAGNDFSGLSQHLAA
jgi:queuine tRNA-ribosyltransferase